MDSVKELQAAVAAFVHERDWEQFHTPANLAKSVSIEAGELLECFQWNNEAFDRNAVQEELADVINYCLCMANALGLNAADIVLAKMEKNARKYPVEKAKGSALKYDQLV